MDAKEYVSKYIIKQNHIVKNITSPLCDFLKIPIFTYFRIEQDGHFINLCNCPDELEFHYGNQFHLNDPHFSHPHLLQSGSLLIPTVYGPHFMRATCTEYKIQYLLLILRCFEEYNEGFVFGTRTYGDNNHANLFTHIDLLHSFTRHFKQEAHYLIERARSEKCSIKRMKGKAFFEQDPSTPLSYQDPNAQKFLKAIMPLSARERQCLKLFKKGKTSQNTAAILGLSPRTVESYFVSIINKLGCHSKRDLLEW